MSEIDTAELRETHNTVKTGFAVLMACEGGNDCEEHKRGNYNDCDGCPDLRSQGGAWIDDEDLACLEEEHNAIPALLSALDAQAATIKAQEGGIERLRAELYEWKISDDEIAADQARPKYRARLRWELSEAQTDNARLTAENAALRERCAAAEADLTEAGPCFTCKHFQRNGGECGGAGRCRVDGAEIQPCDRPGEYRVLIPDDGRKTYERRGPQPAEELPFVTEAMPEPQEGKNQ